MLAKVKKNSRQHGFTLVELLVSIFIISLISGIFMVNYHGASKRAEIGMVKQKLASDIRVAQNNSLGLKTYELDKSPKGGWGVHFDKNNLNQYIIFADTGPDPDNPDKRYNVGEEIEIKTLPAGVTIKSLSPDDIDDIVDIIFFPPDPIIYINGLKYDEPGYSDAEIELTENINNSKAKIKVNFFGLIDME